jgi:hypothetical protein
MANRWVKVALGATAVVGVLGIVIASRPSQFHVEQSIVIAAPPERAVAQVSDFHAWAEWSPYDKMDPNIKRTYSGAASGVGAVYAWTSEKVGEGKMTITSADASHVGIQLDFIKPFECHNTARFSFTPTADGTKVTWAMDGQNNFVGKAMSLFVDIDKFVGKDFERGLADLKARAETSNKATAQKETP